MFIGRNRFAYLNKPYIALHLMEMGGLFIMVLFNMRGVYNRKIFRGGVHDFKICSEKDSNQEYYL